MTRDYTAENNLSQAQYDYIASQKAKEWTSYVQPNEGDFLRLVRICNSDLNYVFHKNKFRFIGEY